MSSGVPHLRVVVWVSLIAIAGYAAFSVWIFGWTDDAALRGDVAGTWKSFAVLAFGFWLGSSSAGKAKDAEPIKTEVVNPPSEPVPTRPAIPEPTFGRDPE